MKNKKGFTLIELLAVIVILAIIALIAVPTIMNVLNKANKSAFKDTAYGLISAGELYFAEQQLELNGMSGEETFEWPDDIKTLQVKGNVPDGTVLKVNTNGETALAMSNERYCITKAYSDNDITITEEFTECDIPTGEKTLSDLAVVSEDLNVDSVAACLTDGTNCAVGTAFAVKVNDTDTYKFRVLNDENNVVTLIMSGYVATELWINEEDYFSVCDEECGYWYEYSFGPITTLKVLKERTSTWINLEEYSYTLEDENGIYADYSGEYVQNVRARLPRLSDIINDAIGCTEHDATCPAWIYEGTSSEYGYYWLSDYLFWVAYDGETSDYPIDDYTNDFHDIRPVITLTK